VGYYVACGILCNIPEERRSLCLSFYHWDWKIQSKYYELHLCCVFVWFSTMSCLYSIFVCRSLHYSLHAYGALNKQLPFLYMSVICDWFFCDIISCLVWLF
jgi:hypothetical protein